MPNKQALIWVISLVLVFGMGVCIGKFLVTPPEVVKQNTLKEIDQKFLEKVKNGLLPIFMVEENGSKEIDTLGGEIIEIDPQKNTLKLKVPNVYRGGNLTEFLYQPDYFIKEVLVDENTKIVKIEIEINESDFTPASKEIPVAFSSLRPGQIISIKIRTPVTLEENKSVTAEVIRMG